MAEYAIFVRAKEMARLTEGRDKHLVEAYESRTAALIDDHIRFGEPDHAPWPCYPLELSQEIWPIPGAQPAYPGPQIDQIKVARGKCQYLQRVHLMKFHAIIDLLNLSTRSRVIEYLLIDIDAYKKREGRIRFRCFDQPATRPAADIKHAPKPLRLCLLWQNATHTGSCQLILDLQTSQFLLAGAILHNIRAGILALGIGRGRHNATLLIFLHDRASIVSPSHLLYPRSLRSVEIFTEFLKKSLVSSPQGNGCVRRGRSPRRTHPFPWGRLSLVRTPGKGKKHTSVLPG